MKLSRSALKIIVSLGLLSLVSTQIDWHQAWRRLQYFSAPFIISAMLYYTGCQLLSCWRWQVILRAEGHLIPLGSLLSSYFAGMFVNIFMPSAVGGDVYRVHRVARQTKDAEVAIASVFLERFTGLAAICALGLIGLPVAFRIVGRWDIILLFIVSVGVISGAVLSIASPRLLIWIEPWLARLGLSRLAGRLGKIQILLLKFARHRQALMGAIGISFVIQLGIIYYLYILAQQLKIPISYWELLVFAPISIIVTLLPISLGGLGVQEGLWAYLFTRISLSAEEAVLLSLSFTVLGWLLSLPGAIFLLSDIAGWQEISNVGGNVGAIGVAEANVATEWDTLAKMNPNLLRFLAESVVVDGSNGAIGSNREGYISVGAQRYASYLIPYGLLTQDVELVATGIKVIEYAFERQNPDGSFQDNSAGSPGESPARSVAFFYHDMGRSLLLLQNDHWFQTTAQTAALRERLNKLLAPADASLTWLMAREAELMRGDGHGRATNRLLIDANAYYLVGCALNRRDAVALGERFIREAIGQQTPDGVFLEKGGYDSSYQGVSLSRAFWLYLNLEPEAVALRQDLQTAIKIGMEWQLTRILANGEVSTEGNSRVRPGGETHLGKEKLVDYVNVILALNYYAQIWGDRSGTAERVFTFYQKFRRGGVCSKPVDKNIDTPAPEIPPNPP